jgi:hypothetical protein
MIILKDGLQDANRTLNEIMAEKAKLMAAIDSLLDHVKDVKAIGPALYQSITCMVPVSSRLYLSFTIVIFYDIFSLMFWMWWTQPLT